MVEIIDDPRSFGLHLDVGSDDILTRGEMIDVLANLVGCKAPAKLHVPLGAFGALSQLIEQLAKLPSGAIRAIVETW